MRQHIKRVNKTGEMLLLLAAAMTMASPSAYAQIVEDWGSNQVGQLGNGTTTNSSTPVAVNNLPSGVCAVAGGGVHSLALQYGGVYAWGLDAYGQLGNGASNTYSTTVVAVSGLSSGVTAIAGGGDHSLAIQNGGVQAWGFNANGQLGNGTTTNSNTPTPVSGLSSGVTVIAGGDDYSLAIQNGGAYAWGLNNFGQLGNGASNTSSSTPVAVSGLSGGVTAIAGGERHSLAIQNGAAYAWGYNSDGELGNSTTVSSSTPVAVSGLSSDVTAVAAGYEHSLALRNGGVYAWGDNSVGELGNGTTNGSSMPAQVDPSVLNNIIAVAAVGESSFALSFDGSLWVWGDNPYGMLGLGTTTTDYLNPQHLLPPPGYAFTSIDGNAVGYHAISVLTPVPEPGSLALRAFAWLGVLGRQRGRALRQEHLPTLKSNS